MNLEAVLQQHFGYEHFRPGQREVIEALLRGEDVVALLPTGMGKSLCYQLAGYIFRKPVLVISPLLSLMQDQVEQMKRFGEKKVIALNSFLARNERQQVLAQLTQYRFIFTSPEMLQQPQVSAALGRLNLSLIVVDEAHCISQWGYDFRPDYLRLQEWLQTVQRPPVLALSATATPKVLADITSVLQMQQPFTYMHEVDRKNIALLREVFATKEEKLPWLLTHIAKTEGPGIIYTRSRKKTVEIATRLQQQNILAEAYHGGIAQEERQIIQQQFIAGTLQWIVATNAFGMGIHKDNVRQVIHETMPANMADYMQEIGRAARDGKQAIATVLYAPQDEELAGFIATDDLPNEYAIKSYMALQESQQLPIQLVTQGVISETAFRMLDYWLQRQTPTQVLQRIATLRLEKLQGVQAMHAVMTTTECLREPLVQYFGQQLTNKPALCCSNCHPQLATYFTARQQQAPKDLTFTWQQRLAQLLAIKN